MELDNILKDIDEEDINPMFYSFTSQLGDIFINNKGENELSFKDNFINIQFKEWVLGPLFVVKCIITY